MPPHTMVNARSMSKQLFLQ